jgi:rhodanese-related sulfurtransferase
MSPELIHNLLIFAEHNWWLLLCFVIIAIWIVVEEGKSKGTGGGQVNPKAAVMLINNDEAIVIDLRSKEAFKKGHIVQSINMPKDQFDLNAPIFKHNLNKKIIVVCMHGNDANRIALKLRKAGYDSKVLAGGIEAWKSADLPLKSKK